MLVLAGPDPGTDVGPAVCILSVSHSSQETLLILLEGGQSGADLQQHGSTLLRTARHQTPVILNPQTVQGLVTHLGNTRTTTMKKQVWIRSHVKFHENRTNSYWSFSSDRCDETFRDLKTQCGVVLLEQDVPDIQSAIHLNCEEDRGSDWTPTGIRQVRHLIPETVLCLKSTYKLDREDKISRET